jgi:hypothetical protein
VQGERDEFRAETPTSPWKAAARLWQTDVWLLENPEIAKLLRDDLELRPVFFGVDGEPIDALASAVAAPIESPDDPRVPLKVGGRELGE